MNANGTITGGFIISNSSLQTQRGDDYALYAPYGGLVAAGSLNANANVNAGGTIQGGALKSNGGGDYAFYVPNGGGVVAGNFTVSGSVITNYVTCYGIVNCPNTADNAFNTGGGITCQGPLISARGGGTTAIYAPYGNLYVGGTGVYGGRVNCGDLYSRGNVFVSDDGNFYLGVGDHYKYVNFAPYVYWTWDWWNGDMCFSQGQNRIMFQIRNGDGQCTSYQGPMAGYGNYINISDRRFKQEDTIITAPQGLNEILQLNPVTFKRIERNYGGKHPQPEIRPELGFIAQEVAEVLPEAVHPVGAELPDGSGGITDYNPTLGVSTGSLTPVLVNAIKELNARIIQLEEMIRVQSKN